MTYFRSSHKGEAQPPAAGPRAGSAADVRPLDRLPEEGRSPYSTVLRVRCRLLQCRARSAQSEWRFDATGIAAGIREEMTTVLIRCKADHRAHLAISQVAIQPASGPTRYRSLYHGIMRRGHRSPG